MRIEYTDKVQMRIEHTDKVLMDLLSQKSYQNHKTPHTCGLGPSRQLSELMERE